jgi:hypothetical protein
MSSRHDGLLLVLDCLVLDPNQLPSRYTGTIKGCLGLLRSTFFSQTVLAPCTPFEKKDIVVRAPKGVLHKLQFFVELLHGGIYRAEFVKPSQTPS